MNTVQELCITAMKGYYNKLLLLHKQACDNDGVKRIEYRELQIELYQHQERSKDASGNYSVKVKGVIQHFGQDELKARLTDQLTIQPGSRTCL